VFPFYPYRGGANGEPYGSWADIGLAEPGIHGDRCTIPWPQSARSEVGCAANAAPIAKTAATATV